jgi:hypothetical protein
MMFGEISLDDAKRQALEKLMTQFQQDFNAGFQKFHAKEWTRDQLRNQTELARSNLDARVRPFLTEDQYRTYLERVTPMRRAQDQWMVNIGTPMAPGADGVLGGNVIKRPGPP